MSANSSDKRGEHLNDSQSTHKTKSNFENKFKTNSYKSDSNSDKTIDNNINTKKPNEDLNRNKSIPFRHNSNHRKTYSNDSYYYNSNRFNNSDRNRPKDYYSRGYDKYSNDRQDFRRRHEFNDRNRRFDKTSEERLSDKTESKAEPIASLESNDANCSKNVDKTEQMGNNLSIILDEITALKSIFDENVLTIDEKELKGRFLAEPVLNSNQLNVFYRTNSTKTNYRNSYANNERFGRYYDNRFNNRRDNYNSDNTSETEEFCVKHLPPIELYFELTADYPLKSNPKFLISCKWLTISQLELICGKLEDLWKETKMEVLFTWFSFLQNEVMNWLRIGDKLGITSIISVKPKWITRTESDSKSSQTNNLTTLSKASLSRYGSGKVIDFQPHLHRGVGTYDNRAVCDLIGEELITNLKAYDEYKQKDVFKKSYFLCNICLTSNLGEDCIVFPCNHINCKTCIRDYFTTLIADGSVNLLKCPETECQTSAPPNMVRELISEDQFKRYDKLLYESVIGTMSDVYYCPRKVCESVVIGDTDSCLAHCQSCGYAFCKNCKFSYHGLDPCQMFRNSEQRKAILDKYSEANGAERMELEKLYGKKQLVAAMEEAATEKWLEDMSKRCPHCKASIEKSDGCNKMSCWRCNTCFCWICLTQLPAINPYSHFNTPGSKCYNQLFRGVNIDDIDDLFDDFVI